MGNSSSNASNDPNTASVSFTVRDFLVTNKPSVPKKFMNRISTTIFYECVNHISKAVSVTDTSKSGEIQSLMKRFLCLFFLGFFILVAGMGCTMGGFIGYGVSGRSSSRTTGEETSKNSSLLIVGIVGVILFFCGIGLFIYAITLQKKAENLNVIWFNDLNTVAKRACDDISQKSQNTMIWNANATASIFVTTGAGNKFGNGEIKVLISLKANKIILSDGFLNINNISMQQQYIQQQQQQPIQYQQPIQVQQQQQPVQYQQQPQSPQGGSQRMMVQLPNGQYQQVMIIGQPTQQQMQSQINMQQQNQQPMQYNPQSQQSFIPNNGEGN